jgi:mycofactocin precursor
MMPKEQPELESINKKAAPGDAEEPQILEEIVVEELSIDGICGVY